MKFEEDFPSLKEIKNNMLNQLWFRQIDVQLYCLDKQKVEEIIDIIETAFCIHIHKEYKGCKIISNNQCPTRIKQFPELKNNNLIIKKCKNCKFIEELKKNELGLM